MTTAPTLLTGAFTALVTPFRHGAIDEQALRNLVEFQISSGINGIVPCGTTGESATLSEAEHARLIEIVIEQTAGRVPVVAGVGSNNTAVAIERARHAAHAGADALLVVAPWYNKPTQTGMTAHFTAIADATDLPLVLYNVPGRTGVTITPETVVTLAQHPNIVAIKEASGSLDAVSQIVAETGPDFVVLSGDDSLTLPMISVGARGVISVASNVVPGEVSRLVALGQRGDVVDARQLHHGLFPLFRAMFLENNPTAVKTAMDILGLCSDELRLPLVPLSPGSREAVRQAIARWIRAGQVAA